MHYAIVVIHPAIEDLDQREEAIEPICRRIVEKAGQYRPWTPGWAYTGFFQPDYYGCRNRISPCPLDGQPGDTVPIKEWPKGRIPFAVITPDGQAWRMESDQDIAVIRNLYPGWYVTILDWKDFPEDQEE